MPLSVAVHQVVEHQGMTLGPPAPEQLVVAAQDQAVEGSSMVVSKELLCIMPCVEHPDCSCACMDGQGLLRNHLSLNL